MPLDEEPGLSPPLAHTTPIHANENRMLSASILKVTVNISAVSKAHMGNAWTHMTWFSVNTRYEGEANTSHPSTHPANRLQARSHFARKGDYKDFTPETQEKFLSARAK